MSSTGVDDGNFNQDIYSDILAFLADHADCSVRDVKEPDMAELVPTVERLVGDYDVFVCPGFNFGVIGDIVLANPDKYFLVVDSTIVDSEGTPVSADNVYTMMYKEEESGFMAGVAAALSSKTGKVAEVNGMPFLSNTNYQFGFMGGVKYANEKYGTNVECVEIPSFSGGDGIGGNYVGAFTDPATGKVVAETLIHEGCDVIFAAAGDSGNGALTGVLVGYLKYRFNIHEVVSTIMINYVISYLIGFFINTYFVDAMTRNSKVCTPEARLTLTNVMIGNMKCKIPLGLIIAVLVALLVSFLFRKSVLGFEIKAVGLNRRCSEYSGIRVSRTILVSMGLSGAIAGLAGVAYYLGYTNTIIPKSLPAMGYDSISVALLGSGSPIGSIFAGAVVAVFQQGANYMSSSVGVAKEIASLITGIMLLFAACGNYMKYRAARTMQQTAEIASQVPSRTAPANRESKEAKNR